MTDTAFFIHQTLNGQRYLNIRGSWHDSLKTLIQDENIDYLYFSSGDWGDFSFLKNVQKNIKILRLTTDCPNLQGLHTLTNLEDLTLEILTQSSLDFSKFPQLKRCCIFWNPNFSFNLFELKQLEYLSIRYDKQNQFLHFSQLENLRELKILDSQLINIRGISKLKKLQNLTLYNLKKLSTLDEIESLPSLNSLSINSCKNIKNLQCIESLNSLQTLHLCGVGNLPSLSFLRNLEQLECFNFSGSTIIQDGNLNLLLELPKLKLVGFQNRRHYSHKFKELQRILEIS